MQEIAIEKDVYIQPKNCLSKEYTLASWHTQHLDAWRAGIERRRCAHDPDPRDVADRSPSRFRKQDRKRRKATIATNKRAHPSLLARPKKLRSSTCALGGVPA
eukprot:6186639-Pleurochrysis_carterae.AAC.2